MWLWTRHDEPLVPLMMYCSFQMLCILLCMLLHLFVAALFSRYLLPWRGESNPFWYLANASLMLHDVIHE